MHIISQISVTEMNVYTHPVALQSPDCSIQWKSVKHAGFSLNVLAVIRSETLKDVILLEGQCINIV